MVTPPQPAAPPARIQCPHRSICRRPAPPSGSSPRAVCLTTAPAPRRRLPPPGWSIVHVVARAISQSCRVISQSCSHFLSQSHFCQSESFHSRAESFPQSCRVILQSFHSRAESFHSRCRVISQSCRVISQSCRVISSRAESFHSRCRAISQSCRAISQSCRAISEQSCRVISQSQSHFTVVQSHFYSRAEPFPVAISRIVETSSRRISHSRAIFSCRRRISCALDVPLSVSRRRRSFLAAANLPQSRHRAGAPTRKKMPFPLCLCALV